MEYPIVAYALLPPYNSKALPIHPPIDIAISNEMAMVFVRSSSNRRASVPHTEERPDRFPAYI